MAFPLFPQMSVRRTVRYAFLKAFALLLPIPMLGQGHAASAVKIPFAFAADDHAMPAGDYLLSRVSDHIYALSHPDGTMKRCLVVSDSFIAAPPRTNKLVFWNFEGRHFLVGFWTGGSQRGYEVRSGKAEQDELATTRTSAQPTISAATLVALDMRDIRAR